MSEPGAAAPGVPVTAMPTVADSVAPTVLVTRPQPQADAWVARLQAAGVSALALPLLRIEPDAAFLPAVARAWQTLAGGGWHLVMFVSPNAVLQFFEQAPASGHEAWPTATLAGATGPGTVAALRAAGVPEAAIAQPAPTAPSFDAEALWRDALAARDWSGRAVLIVRGETGRDWLADTLRSAGAQVETLAAYRQRGPDWQGEDASLARNLQWLGGAAARGEQRPVWLFSSSQAIAHLCDDQAAPGAGPADVRDWPALATHPRIADTARRAGFRSVREVRPDVAAVAAALREDRSIQ